MHQTDIYIAITTYDRPEDLQLLMDDISRDTAGKNVHVHVYDDFSPMDNSVDKGYDITKYGRNHGKKGYWSIMNDVFRDAETWNFKYFFFLQDDCRLIPGFFDLAINEFNAIEDINKATLCTFTPQSIYDRYMWSEQNVKDVLYGDRKYIQSNYVDCIFMCPRETLQLLNFKIDPVPLNRFSRETISSGVGQQLTLRLMRSQKTMWCAYSSLIISHSNDSKMNKQERQNHPLTPLLRPQEPPIKLSELLGYQPKEKVIAGMASIKSRAHILKKTIQSIINQVDHIHVYLNDYDSVPQFLQNNYKITFYLGKIYKDRGDTGKYFAINKVEDGYFFSCDDDLLYPKDYVEKTVAFLKSHNDRVIATYHGAILKQGKLSNYYRDRKQIHYSHFQRESMEVNIGGTGVMAFHVDTFKPDITQFTYPNMSDIWVSIQAQEKRIPILCAPRSLDWIRAEKLPESETIYGSKKNHDMQTNILNEWKERHGEFEMV